VVECIVLLLVVLGEMTGERGSWAGGGVRLDMVLCLDR